MQGQVIYRFHEVTYLIHNIHLHQINCLFSNPVIDPQASKRLTSRFRILALASLAGFAFGGLMEYAYFKSGYCKNIILYIYVIVLLCVCT